LTAKEETNVYNMPAVSIIVPVYNTERYIEKCLESLVNQTLKDIQIVIVNDGSTDGSSQIIDKFLQRHHEKIVYIEKKNGGLSEARNVGMQYATSDYIGFVDSDDYVELTMYEKMYNKAKEDCADLVECDFYWEYSKRIKQDIGKFYDLNDMLVKVRVMAWNKIIKNDLLKKDNLQYPAGLRYEDIEFSYKLIPRLKKIGFVKEPLYHYMQRDNSISHVQNDKTRDIFQVLDGVINYYKDNDLYEEYKEKLEYVYMRYLLGSSFLRIVKIDIRELREIILSETWEKLNSNFPGWKKNPILKRSILLKDLYFRTINRFTYKLYSKLFHVIMAGKQ
jgi:glycosyltransferase involved in cell wall biosynthesis